ncbi:alpha/beta fold hydrolase [Mesobacterium pallidum]|uniref:alpha/beta fold hydrolase n=1 Tax=Mesobacterium pallidum TaxID=2872037 RepID=UPI001EE1921D|nr:alpha/beta hydrolase [Mesobacterium pallidum]
MTLAAKILIALVALVLAGAIATLWKARHHERAAEARWPAEGQLLDVGGHQVHAVVMGAGPDLVLIHGASGNTRDMTFRLAPALAEHFRVIVLDRPGLGYTHRINRTGATITDQAALLSGAARQLGAERPLVVGQSYGGAVALAWAVTQPDHIAGMVSISGASHPWDTGLSTYYKALSHPWIGPLVIPLLTAWVPDRVVEANLSEVFAPQAVPEGYAAHFGPGLTLRRESLRANALQRANLLGEIETLSPRYSDLTLPIEIVHGDADTTVSPEIHARRLVAEVPSARLEILPGIGHMPQHVAVEAVVAACLRTAARAGLGVSDR